MRRLVFVLLAVTVATSAAAQLAPRAGGLELRLPPGSWWENPRVVERLALTPEQQAAIADVVYRHALAMVDLKAAVDRAELELKAQVGRGELVPDRVRSAFRAFQAARTALESERFEMLLAVRQQLSPQQWSELQAAHQEVRRNLRQRVNPRRPGEPPPGPGR